MLNEYRCTFPELYCEGSPGFANKNARQGHYVAAKDEKEALDLIRAMARSKGIRSARVDVQLWKQNYWPELQGVDKAFAV